MNYSVFVLYFLARRTNFVLVRNIVVLCRDIQMQTCVSRFVYFQTITPLPVEKPNQQLVINHRLDSDHASMVLPEECRDDLGI